MVGLEEDDELSWSEAELGEEERRDVQRDVDLRRVGRSEAGWDAGWLEEDGDAGLGEWLGDRLGGEALLVDDVEEGV
jgi:hypothetical protein